MPLGLGKGAGHHLTENSLPFMFPPSLACLREMLLLLLSLLSNTVVFCFALAMETHKKKRDFLMISIFRCICLPEYPRAYSYWEWGRGRGGSVLVWASYLENSVLSYQFDIWLVLFAKGYNVCTMLFYFMFFEHRVKSSQGFLCVFWLSFM